MPRKPRRDTWRQVHGRWVRSLGSRGARIRLFEMTKGGPYYRDVWIGGRKSRKCLGTTDRAEAERLAKELLASLLREEAVVSGGVVTLRSLWDRYRIEATGFLDNAERTRRDDASHAAVLIGHFRENCDVRHLTEADVQAFVAARMRGGIEYKPPRRKQKDAAGTVVSRPVRTRAADADVQLLRAMLRWGCTVRVRGGQRLLATNPLAALRGVKEKNPKRPLATVERFTATRKAMQELAEASAGDPAKHQLWVRMELALVLAEATGRRLGAIRHLRWEDFDFANGKVSWRADTDKIGRDWVVPLPAELLTEIKRFRLKLGGVFGGLLFPSLRDLEKPLDRHAFQKSLIAAEQRAELPKLDGSAWHAYRRAWASARKHLPLADVAHAGGWKGAHTLLTVYQQPDVDTLLTVMSEPRKVSERAAGT